MSKELTEAKELTRQVMEKISQHELLEEARERGFVKGAKFKDIMNSGTAIFTVDFIAVSKSGFIHCGTGIIYDPNQNKWAEIIPEQKEEREFNIGDEVKITLQTSKFYGKTGIIEDVQNGLYKIGNHNEVFGLLPPTVLQKLPEKSLHDQIREGGWKKVFELARFKIETRCIETYPIHPISRIDSHPMTKADTYIKLLALSKVLNEGKEKGKYYYIINSNSIDLYIDGWNGNAFPIWFYLEEDAFFALEFAEKEWKIFYNTGK